MTDNGKMVIKYVAEAAVWIAFWGFAITGCVQCHRIDTENNHIEKSKP